MSDYARIRVRKDQARLLLGLLFRERGVLITDKIRSREAGEDTSEVRRALLDIKYLMEETKRAIRDVEEPR